MYFYVTQACIIRITIYQVKYLMPNLFPKYAQWSFEDKRSKGKHLSNLSPHLFVNFLIESHYLDHLLFQQAFFVKNPFFHFQHSTYIFFNTFLFQTEHHHHIFFINFRLTLKNIFFEENEYDTHFLNFLFNIPKYIFLKKMNKTLTFNFFFIVKYHLIFSKKQN